MNDVKPLQKCMTAQQKSLPLFWLGFWLLFIKFLWQATVVVPVDEMVLRVLLLWGMAFLALRVAVLLPHYKRRALVMGSLFAAAVSYVLSGETVLLSTLLVVFAATGVGAQTVIRAWCRAVAPLLVLMLACYGMAELMGETIGETFSDIGGLRDMRGALFFIHPNYCGAYFFSYAIGQCMRKDVSVPMKVACYLCSLAVIYFITGSRTSTLSLLSYPALALTLRIAFGRIGERAAKGTSIVVVLVPVLLSVFTYWLGSYWFTSPMFSQELSDLLTGRPALWWAQYNYAGLTLLGQPAFQGTVLVRGTYHEVATVDGMYSSFLYNIGLVGFLCILALLYLWARRAKSNELELMSAAVLALFLFGFCEWHAANALVCVPLLLLGDSMELKELVTATSASASASDANVIRSLRQAPGLRGC